MPRISQLPQVLTPDPDSPVAVQNLTTNQTARVPLSAIISLFGLATGAEIDAALGLLQGELTTSINESRVQSTSDVAGSANAITANIPFGVAEGGLFMMTPVVTNTNASVTLTLNGGTTRPLRTLGGANLGVGRLVAGRNYLIKRVAGNYLIQFEGILESDFRPLIEALQAQVNTGLVLARVQYASAVGGSANSITATFENAIPDGGYGIFVADAANTGASVTLAVNGGTAWPLQTVAGANVGIGRVVAGRAYLVRRVGNAYRIVLEGITPADVTTIATSLISTAIATSESLSRIYQASSVAGTENAITATTPAAIVDGGSFLITAVATNTAASVSLAMNGGTAWPLQTVAGANVGIGRVVSGRNYLVRRVGNSYRIQLDGFTNADFLANAIPTATSVAGTATAYTASTATPVTAEGSRFIFVPHLDNGNNPTLSVNGASARQIRRLDGTNPAPGSLVSNTGYLLALIGSYYVILLGGTSSSGGSSGSASPAVEAAARAAITGKDVGAAMAAITAPIYFGKSSKIVDSQILSAGLDPAWAFSFTGTGALPSVDPDEGLIFTAGQFLRWTGTLPATVRKLIVMVDMTRNADPSSSSGTIFDFATTGTSRSILRYLTAQQFQMLNPTTSHNTLTMGATGDRSVVGLEIDFENGTWAVLEPDGYILEGTHTGASAGVSTVISIGQSCNITIHSLSVAMAFTDGADLPVSIYELARALRETDYPNRNTDLEYEAARVNGQSNALSQNDVNTRLYLSHLDSARDSVKMLTGLQVAGGIATYLHGPAGGAYNEAVPASGVVPAYAQGNITTGYPFAIALAERRRAKGLKQRKLVTGFCGQAGQAITAFDAGSTLFENWEFWQSEAIRLVPGLLPGYYGWIQGEADRDLSAGAYLAAGRTTFQDIWNLDQQQFGAPSKMLMFQIGGSSDSVGHNYFCKDELLDLCEEFGGIYVTSLDRYPLVSDGVHLTAQSTLLVADTAAWAAAEVESGHGWSMLRPTVLSNTGGVLRLKFPLRQDEGLVVDDEIYAGARPTNLGFQLTGGTITSVVAAGGAVVTINYTGTPTAVAYSMQSATITPVEGGYSVHRGELRSSLTEPSVLVPGETLKRWVPSFRIAL